MNAISFDTFKENTNPAIKIKNKVVTQNQVPRINILNAGKSNDKLLINKNKLKKFTCFLLLLFAAVALLKLNRLNKTKKEIIKLYDYIFEEIKKGVPDSFFNFEKPKLIFKKLDKYTGSSYVPADNVIKIEPKSLRRICINKNMQKTYLTSILKDVKIANLYYRGSVWDMVTEGFSDKYKRANKDEAFAIIGSTLVHEITHAKQFQILLCANKGVEQYVQSIKINHPNLSNSDIKRLYPFIYSYTPKMFYPAEETVIYEKIIDGSILKFKIKDIIDAFVEYALPDIDEFKYFTNLTEICARNNEAIYWDKLDKNDIKIPVKIDKEFLQHFKAMSRYNVITLLKAANAC